MSNQNTDLNTTENRATPEQVQNQTGTRTFVLEIAGKEISFVLNRQDIAKTALLMDRMAHSDQLDEVLAKAESLVQCWIKTPEEQVWFAQQRELFENATLSLQVLQTIIAATQKTLATTSLVKLMQSGSQK